MPAPLEDITVTDVSQFISGPYCATLLAEMGAEVIKIEPPDGDPMRVLTAAIDPKLESLFCALNKNKKGITLNLRSEQGAEICQELASKSDVFVENLGPGVMERFGLGYDELSKLNPRLIYVSITGFGKNGPLKNRPSFDLIAQAMGGTIPLVGLVGGRPKMFLGDIVTGVYSALGAMYALYHRERTGKGQLVDMSLQDVVYSINIGVFTHTMLGEGKPEQIGFSFEHYPPGIRIPFYGIFPAQDGRIAIAAVTDKQARRCFKALGVEELADDEKFSNFFARFVHDEELLNMVSEFTSRMKRDEIVKKLVAARVPCGPVYEPTEVGKDSQLKARDMFHEVKYKGFKFPLPGVCIKLLESPGAINSPAPELGQHNEEILCEMLKYPKTEIERLKKSGVV